MLKENLKTLRLSFELLFQRRILSLATGLFVSLVSIDALAIEEIFLPADPNELDEVELEKYEAIAAANENEIELFRVNFEDIEDGAEVLIPLAGGESRTMVLHKKTQDNNGVYSIYQLTDINTGYEENEHTPVGLDRSAAFFSGNSTHGWVVTEENTFYGFHSIGSEFVIRGKGVLSAKGGSDDPEIDPDTPMGRGEPVDMPVEDASSIDILFLFTSEAIENAVDPIFFENFRVRPNSNSGFLGLFGITEMMDFLTLSASNSEIGQVSFRNVTPIFRDPSADELSRSTVLPENLDMRCGPGNVLRCMNEFMATDPDVAFARERYGADIVIGVTVLGNPDNAPTDAPANTSAYRIGASADEAFIAIAGQASSDGPIVNVPVNELARLVANIIGANDHGLPSLVSHAHSYVVERTNASGPGRPLPPSKVSKYEPGLFPFMTASSKLVSGFIPRPRFSSHARDRMTANDAPVPPGFDPAAGDRFGWMDVGTPHTNDVSRLIRERGPAIGGFRPYGHSLVQPVKNLNVIGPDSNGNGMLTWEPGDGRRPNLYEVREGTGPLFKDSRVVAGIPAANRREYSFEFQSAGIRYYWVAACIDDQSFDETARCTDATMTPVERVIYMP